MIMHPSFGHGVLANTFPRCTCGLEPPAFTSCSSVPCSGYHGLVSSILASICNPGREDFLACVCGYSKQHSCVDMGKSNRQRTISLPQADLFLCLHCLYLCFLSRRFVMGVVSFPLTLTGVASTFSLNFLSHSGHQSRSAFCNP